MVQMPGTGGGGTSSGGTSWRPVYSGAVSGGYYLDNLVTIGEYLMRHGYSRAAAAGIAGTIAGESAGNPDVYNDLGLIQWTPASKAAPIQPIVTGSPQRDFTAQLTDILYYNNQQGSELVRQLNAQTSPVAAADYYSQNFERPAVSDSDVRPSVASYVYDKLAGKATTGTLGGTGGTGTGSGGTGGGSGTTSTPQTAAGVFSAAGGMLSGALGLFHAAAVVLDRFFGLFAPGQAWRLAFALAAIVLLLLAFRAFTGPGVLPAPA